MYFLLVLVPFLGGRIRSFSGMLGELMIYLSLEKVPKVGATSNFQGLVIAARDLEVEACSSVQVEGRGKKIEVEVLRFQFFALLMCICAWYLIYDIW